MYSSEKDYLAAFKKLTISDNGSKNDIPKFYTMFEDGSGSEMVHFQEYNGPMVTNHQKYRQWIPIMTKSNGVNDTDNFNQFQTQMKRVFQNLTPSTFPIKLVLRFGITYCNGRLFNFKERCTAQEFSDAANSETRGDKKCYRPYVGSFQNWRDNGATFGTLRTNFFPEKGCNKSDEFIKDLGSLGYKLSDEYMIITLHFKTTSGNTRIIVINVEKNDGTIISLRKINLEPIRLSCLNVIRDKSKSQYPNYDDIYDIRYQLKTESSILSSSDIADPILKDIFGGKISLDVIITRDQKSGYVVAREFARFITFVREETKAVFRKAGEDINIRFQNYRQFKCDQRTGECVLEMTADNTLDARIMLTHESDLDASLKKMWQFGKTLADIATKASTQPKHQVQYYGEAGATIEKGYTAEQRMLMQKAQKSDYFDLLGLDRSATDKDVLKSYRKLSLLVHPDKCGHKEATEAFKTLQKAYETLETESGRRDYGTKLDQRKFRGNNDFQHGGRPPFRGGFTPRGRRSYGGGNFNYTGRDNRNSYGFGFDF